MKTVIHPKIEDYRMYKATNFITLLGIPAHSFFIPLFFYLGYETLALFNFLSVALWVSARFFNNKGKVETAIALLVIEVFTHAIFATIIVGIEGGFQFYFFGLIPFIMFHQGLSKNGFFTLAFIITLSYALSMYFSNKVVHNEIEPLIMNMLYYGNTIVVMFGMTLTTTYFRDASLELEGALKETVKDREVLLKEVHHRVKNNMQIIISLLHLQGDKYNNEASQQIIQATESRINAMLLVHEKLFQNESVSCVNVGSYLQALTEDLKYNLESSHALEIELVCDDISFHIDKLIPIGLIVNEAVTNSIKYADFKTSPLIQIGLFQEENSYLLRIKDNGKTKPKKYEKEGSIGMDLIHGLARSKLKGKSEVMYKDGTLIEIKFKENI